MANFDLENYATVQERIAQFYKDFPNGSIRTFMVRLDGPEVIFEARAFRTPEEVGMGVYTSGFAREIEGKTPVNRTSFLENCESSAVGRALANLGYAADARRPSRSEMLKVRFMEEERDRLLAFIKNEGQEIGEDAVLVTADKKERKIKEYVRNNWAEIKSQIRLARMVVDAMEKALPVQGNGERQAAA